jgi:hypothetical protein
MRTLIRATPIALLALAACGHSTVEDTNADDLAPAVVSDTPQAQVTHGIPLGGKSTLSLRTLPNAACNLRPADEPAGANDNLRVYSDDTGIARVHVMDTVGKPQNTKVFLDCADDQGRTFSHEIHVNASAVARGHAPAPYAPANPRKLAALDVDPMSLSAEEIAARQYPPRPDPTASPGHYQHWLDLLRARPTLVSNHLFNEPGRSHGPISPTSVSNGNATSGNWSGYVITSPSWAKPYGEVYGVWHVPQVYAQGGFWNDHHSSFWVGMDGWGTPDVVQDGTEENTYTYFWTQWSSYSAWVEWYPLNEQGVNLSVNAGDEIRAWTWVGTSSSSAVNTSGNVGWFYLWNVTQNTAAAYVTVTAPAGTVFNGHQAEWVMERPGVNGSTSTLANYGSATMTYPAAADANGTWHWFSGDSVSSSTNISMYNGSDLLSSVTAPDGNTLQFTWHNYQ